MVLPQHEALLCLLIVRCVQTWHLEAPRAEQMLCQAGSHPLCPDPCEGRGSSEPGQGEKKAHQPLSRAAGVQQCRAAPPCPPCSAPPGSRWVPWGGLGPWRCAGYLSCKFKFLPLAAINNTGQKQALPLCRLPHCFGLEMLFLHVSKSQNEHGMGTALSQELFFRLHLVL